MKPMCVLVLSLEIVQNNKSANLQKQECYLRAFSAVCIAILHTLDTPVTEEVVEHVPALPTRAIYREFSQLFHPLRVSYLPSCYEYPGQLCVGRRREAAPQ